MHFQGSRTGIWSLLLASFALALVTAAALADEPTFKVGFAKRDITPTASMPMWGYGERPWRLALVMAFFIVFFGTLFHVLDPLPGKTWWEHVYFAGITYLTVGYGDLAPISPFAQLLSLICAASGIGTFGLLIASVTKILRKSCGEKTSGAPAASVRPVAARALSSSLRSAVGVIARRSLPTLR